MYFRSCLLFVLLCASSASRAGSGKAAAEAANLSRKKPLSVLITVSFMPGHLFAVIALGEELVKRGHNVTLVTTEMEGSRLLPELPESMGIRFVSAGYSMTKKTFELRMKQLSNSSMDRDTENTYLDELSAPVIQIGKKVDEIGAENFDIIVAEVATFPLLPYFVHKGSKVVVVSTKLPPLQASSPPWPTAGLGTSQTDNLTFFERLWEPFLILKYRQRYMERFEAVMADSHFEYVYGYHEMDLHIPGIEVPLLITTVIGFEYPRAITPLTHYVGPVLMSSSPPLDPVLQQWLDKKPDKSVIYISMGTTASLSREAASALISGISVTSFYAVWSLRTSNQHILDGISLNRSKFYISSWIPQQTLLRHKSIRMAILHCGMNGVHEALYNGVPIITAPYALDQFENAARVCHAGAGVKLVDHLHEGFSSQQVEEAIFQIDAQGCRRKAQKLRRLFIQAGCTVTAADLVEYYENVGWEHLVPAYAKYDWSWVHYYSVDICLLLATAVFFFLLCLFKVLRLCLLQCCHRWTSQRMKKRRE